jgi:hypothetical protein
LKTKEELFALFYDLAADIEEKEGVEVTDGQREEVEKLREEFSRNAKQTWNTVMSQEMTLVTQTEQVFVSNLITTLHSYVYSIFRRKIILYILFN